MDDFNVSSLHESRNEWCAKLITILTPLVIDGYKSILEEAVKLCKQNGEMEKYLMTFQNFVSRIPKWNSTIIETERKRICDKSGCVYLEDLVTCVHIIQLKVLTAMRVGQKQKKIDLDIPKLDDFVHKLYISVARKVYKNVYLFEVNVMPLQIQKNHRELEIIVQECILNTLREGIPVEAILKAYMDETVEEDVVEEVHEQIIDEPIKQSVQVAESKPAIEGGSELPVPPPPMPSSRLSFNDIDSIKTDDGTITSVVAPKSIPQLEERAQQRRMEEAAAESTPDMSDKLHISDQSFSLDALDVHSIEEPAMELLPDLLMDEIEVLE
jgi:hypothetical protein